MRRISLVFLCIVSAMVIDGCCGVAPRPPEPPLVAEAEPDAGVEKSTAPEPEAPKGPRLEPPIWMAASEVASDCDISLKKAEALRQQVVGVADERTATNTLIPVNDLIFEVYNLMSMSELMANVHPDKTVRDAAEVCQQDAVRFLSKFELDRDVYDALTALDASGFDALTKRFWDHLIRDYKLAGVDKDEETRKKLADLQEKMTKTGQDFARAIREGKRSIVVEEKDVKGLPEAFVKAHATEDGKFEFTTDYPDFMPVVSYAEKESVRKALYIEFLKRAYPENEKNLKTLLELRHEYATILDYPSWAEYNAQDKMAKSEKIISDFIEKVSDIARPRMKKDLKVLLKRKKKDVRNAAKVRVWDRFYYANKVREEKFGVDAKALRSYFEYTKVIEGVLKFNEQLFGVTFERAGDAAVWHEEVEAYNVLEDGEVVGRFYMDMHPRDGKYTHAAEFGMMTGMAGRQLPSASLVCNFPRPSDDAPALMEHDQVVTVFHELGHLMHQILAGHHKYATQSGISCERDFVEVPSQMLENWAWRHEVLSRFAVHVETGEPISEKLVKKMNDADEFARGAHVMRQMFFASLSLAYHAKDPAAFSLLTLMKDIQKQYNPYPYEEGTYIFANFGHLEGYTSLYYTYMWSLALCEDMFTRFEKEGIMNPQTARDFREKVLEPGGTVDADEMVRNFLGREHSFDALEAYLTEK